MTRTRFSTPGMFDTDSMKRYIGLEFAPVREIEGECEAFETEEQALEAAEEEGGTVYWSVYGILPNGTVECIGDYASSELAMDIFTKLLGPLKQCNI